MAGKVSLEIRFEQLKSEDPNVRFSACESLWSFKNKAELTKIKNELRPLLKDKTNKVANSAIKLLEHHQYAHPDDYELVVSIVRKKSNPKNLKKASLVYLGHFGSIAVQGVIDHFYLFPEEAIQALKNMNHNDSDSSEILTPLIPHFRNESYGASLCTAVGKLNLDSEVFITEFRSIIHDPEMSFRHQVSALKTLAKLVKEDAIDDALLLARRGDQGYSNAPEMYQPHVIAASCIAKFQEKGWPQLKTLLESNNPDDQFAAIHSLEAWRSPNDEAKNLLFDALNSTNTKVSMAATEIVKHLGLINVSNDRDVLLDVIKKMGSDNWEVRVSALKVLSPFDLQSVDPDGNRSIPILVSALEDFHFMVRKQALFELRWWNEKAAPAVPRLLEILGDSTGWIDEAEKLGGPGTREIIEQTIENPNRKTFLTDKKITSNYIHGSLINYLPRNMAAEALLEIGSPHADATLEVAKKALQEKPLDKMLKNHLVNLVAKYDQSNPEVTEKILTKLKSRKHDDINDGMEMLKQLNSVPDPVIKQFRKFLTPKSRQLNSALTTLRWMGDAGQPFLVDVAKLTPHEDDSVRRSVLWVLEEIKPDSISLITSDLLPLNHDSHLENRIALVPLLPMFGVEFQKECVPLNKTVLKSNEADQKEKIVAAVSLCACGKFTPNLLPYLHEGLSLDFSGNDYRTYFERQDNQAIVREILKLIPSIGKAAAPLKEKIELHTKSELEFFKELANKALKSS